ncbi:MAG: carbon starvation protein A, partial [Verrucomicrobiota bacterium]
LLKMQLKPQTPETAPSQPLGKPALALITLIPLVWLLSATMTAGVQKIWHTDPRIGFLAAAKAAEQKREVLRPSLPTVAAEPLAAQRKEIQQLSRQIFNFKLDAFVAAAFLILVSIIVAVSIREWILLLARKKISELRETPPVWLPDYAVAESRPTNVMSLIALGFALLKELSGEAHLERAQQQAHLCECQLAKESLPSITANPKTAEQIYLESTEQRFTGVRRCC